ncbi:MAG: response regulator [Nanoarchaeota archaeon]|nr:response regulator [Nanoarchaeota archaeon]
MSDRKLRIALLDDDKDNAEATKFFIARIGGKSALNHIDFEIESFHEPFKEGTYEILEKGNYNLILTDLVMPGFPKIPLARIPNWKSYPAGFRLAYNLKKSKPNRRIIGISGYEEPQGRNLTPEESLEYSGVRRVSLREDIGCEGIAEGVFDDFWFKASDPNKLLTKIGNKKFIPIDVGMVGFGRFGSEFAKILIKAPSINTIKGYSEHSPLEEIATTLDPYKEGKIKFFEGKDGLEKVLDGTEMVIITSSAVKREQIESIPHGPDRAEFFPFEKEKIGGYLKRIKNYGYKGLILILTNPIGHLLEYGHRLSIPHYQLTSPFNTDFYRLENSLDKNLFKVGDKKRFVGIHGIPKICLLDILLINKKNYNKIKNAENECVQKGLEIARAYSRTGVISEEPVRNLIEFFDDFASLRPHPEKSAYCYHSLNYEDSRSEGFVATPASFIYKPFLGIVRDEEKIEKLKEGYLYYNPQSSYLFGFLEKQEKDLDNYLTQSEDISII